MIIFGLMQVGGGNYNGVAKVLDHIFAAACRAGVFQAFFFLGQGCPDLSYFAAVPAEILVSWHRPNLLKILLSRVAVKYPGAEMLG